MRCGNPWNKVEGKSKTHRPAYILLALKECLFFLVLSKGMQMEQFGGLAIYLQIQWKICCPLAQALPSHMLATT